MHVVNTNNPLSSQTNLGLAHHLCVPCAQYMETSLKVCSLVHGGPLGQCDLYGYNVCV